MKVITRKVAVDPLPPHVCLVFADGPQDVGVGSDLRVVNLETQSHDSDPIVYYKIVVLGLPVSTTDEITNSRL